MDIEGWLQSLDLGEYVSAFVENRIEADVLADLSDQDLKDLGVVALGDRKRLLAAIAGLSPVPALPQEADSPRTAAVQGEWRQVTVLFADLAAFTSLSSELGAEATHALLNRYFERVDAIVERHGGSIDKHIGDNVMALFGALVAHGNDAERAVRSAFEIHKAMAELSDEFGRTLEAHIGIASGKVVASGTGSQAHSEYTVTGDAVNLAARLEARAEGAETLVSQAVYSAVEALVQARSLGELDIKGLTEPLCVWRLGALRENAVGQLRPPFVGRAMERRQFAGLLDECVASGCGQVLLLRGEAGIGKSRLTDEFADLAAARGFVQHKALILDFDMGQGLDALRLLVLSLLGLGRDADLEARRRAGQSALQSGSVTEAQHAFLNGLLDLPQPQGLADFYAAMDRQTRLAGLQTTAADLLSAAARRAPILLVVEDIHWADSLTLSNLAALAHTVAEAPALLLLTSRTEGDPLDSAWRGSLKTGALMTIDLQPLRPAEAEALAGTITGEDSTALRKCIERADGNPLFLEQLLRNIDEAQSENLPDSLHSLVLARIDRLAAPDKAALQAAAVLGQRFDLDPLRHLLGDSAYDGKALIEHVLIRPEASGYLFAHAIIRDGVYATLLGDRRRGLHARAAAWFVDRDALQWARHLEQAEDPAAADAYLQAARKQAAGYRHAQALDLVRRGRALPSDASAAFALAIEEGELQQKLADSRASFEAFKQALALAENDRDRCSAWIGMAAAARMIGDFERGTDALRAAEALALKENIPAALSQTYYYLGALEFAQGNVAGCLALHQKAFDCGTEADNPEWIARALSGLGDGHYAEGRIATAMGHIERCMDIAKAQGLLDIEVSNRLLLGNLRRYANDLDKALEDVETTAKNAARLGHWRAEFIANLLHGEFLTEKGEFAAALPPLRRAKELVADLGNDNYLVYADHHLARRLLAQGERDAARAALAEVRAVSARGNQRFFGPRVLASSALAAETRTAGRRFLAQGEKVLLQGCIAHNHFWFYRDALEFALEAGDWPDVERFLRGFASCTVKEPVPWCDFFMARARALMRVGQGERNAELKSGLSRLEEQARAIGMTLVRPALVAALRDF